MLLPEGDVGINNVSIQNIPSYNKLGLLTNNLSYLVRREWGLQIVTKYVRRHTPVWSPLFLINF